VIICQQFA